MNQHALAVVNSDGWDEVPETTGLIHGKIVKFNDGEFILDKQSVINGASFVVMGVVSAWVKFTDGVPEHRVTGPGQRHPDREELGDLDQTVWKPGLSGESEDPWKDTRYLYLVDRKTAEEITFITDTKGGRRAIGALKSQIALFRRAHPGATPVVKLVAGKMKTIKFGLKPCPVFEVTGWITATDGHEVRQIELNQSPSDAALEPTHIKGPARQPSRPATTCRDDDVDDDIPF